MNAPEEAVLLRILIGESDKDEGKPVYETLILKARESGLAGATALRGFMGFGGSSHLHTTKLLRLSYDLPVIIEIVDEKAKIEAFMPTVDRLVKGGLVTMEPVKVAIYRRTKPSGD